MRDKPWQVINLLTDQTLEWCTTDDEAYLKYKGEPVSIIYRPGRKKKVKK